MKNFRYILLLVAVVLAALMPMASFAQGNGGNQDCPAGTSLIAKFNWVDGAGWVVESGSGVTITGDAFSGTWTSTFFVSDIVVKGGPGSYVDVNPNGFSGTYTNQGLPLVGNRNPKAPAISNLKFCGGGQPQNGECIPDGMADLRITNSFVVGNEYFYDVTNQNNTGKNQTYLVGAAAYKVYAYVIINGNKEPVLDGQTLTDSETANVGPGQTVQLSVVADTSGAWQVDVFCGPVIDPLSSSNKYGPRLLFYFYNLNALP